MKLPKKYFDLGVLACVKVLMKFDLKYFRVLLEYFFVLFFQGSDSFVAVYHIVLVTYDTYSYAICMAVLFSACWSCCSWGYWRTNHWLCSWQEGQLWFTSLQISNDLYITYRLIACCLIQDSSVCPKEGLLPDAKQGSLQALQPII